jgi:hypothetical protein
MTRNGEIMSIFANPASRSIEQARQYVAAVLDLLGSKDPMIVLSSTPDAVRNAVVGLTERELSQPEAPANGRSGMLFDILPIPTWCGHTACAWCLRRTVLH